MLTTRETASVLRAMLPLLRLPEQLGAANVVLCVDSAADVLAGTDGELVGARIDRGIAFHDQEAIPVAEAWLRGTVPAWLDLLFDKGRPELQLGGAPDLAEACLGTLRGALAAGEQPEPALA